MNQMNPKIIFETVAGSYLYGTSIENSDIDYRGVCIEPLYSLLGLVNFEQFEDSTQKDRVIYGLRKFINLALGQNPNIVELLFVPFQPEFMIQHTLEWKQIIENREYFLSRKVADTFIGYAVSQLKRMETHYKWMKKEAPTKPDPFDYSYKM